MVALVIPKTVVLFLCISNLIFSQENSEIEKLNNPQNLAPCEHTIIQKATVQGLNSLSPLEIPVYWVKSIQCRRAAKKIGKEVNFKYLHDQKMRENYRDATEISGPGSCFTSIIIVTLFFSYYGYFFAPKR